MLKPHVRQCWYVLKRYSLIILIEQRSISSLSPSTKSLRVGIVNSTKNISGKAGFCVSATKLDTEKVQDNSLMFDLIQQAVQLTDPLASGQGQEEAHLKGVGVGKIDSF